MNWRILGAIVLVFALMLAAMILFGLANMGDRESNPVEMRE